MPEAESGFKQRLFRASGCRRAEAGFPGGTEGIPQKRLRPARVSVSAVLLFPERRCLSPEATKRPGSQGWGARGRLA